MQMKKAVFWDLQGTLGGEATGKIEDFEPFHFAKEALLLTKAAEKEALANSDTHGKVLKRIASQTMRWKRQR